jgi:hypothetical protein
MRQEYPGEDDQKPKPKPKPGKLRMIAIPLAFAIR